jgi:glucokinase
MSARALGVDIGGTFTKLVVVDDSNAIVHRSRIATDDSPASRLPDDVQTEVARIEATVGPMSSIGVACPGLVDRGDEVVYWMKGRLDVLEGLDWTRALGRPHRVRVINDAQAALAGECALGGAIMCDGRVITGSIGRAGHLGHITVQASGGKDIVNTPGSLEDAIGNCTVSQRTAGRFTSTADLVAAHLAGDAGASRVWLASVQQLAAGIVSIVNAVDPSRVILGGGIASHAGEALLSPLRVQMSEYEWRPRGVGVEIVLATLGDEAGAIGAAAYAREQLA